MSFWILLFAVLPALALVFSLQQISVSGVRFAPCQHLDEYPQPVPPTSAPENLVMTPPLESWPSHSKPVLGQKLGGREAALGKEST